MSYSNLLIKTKIKWYEKKHQKNRKAQYLCLKVLTLSKMFKDILKWLNTFIFVFLSADSNEAI